MNARDEQETERLLKGIELNPSEGFERRMKELWAAAAEEGVPRETRREGARNHRLLRKRLLRVGIPIAAVCLALLAGHYLLSGRGVMRSAYAELMEAVENSREAEWMHGKGTMAGKEFEIWFSLHPLRGFLRHGDDVQGEDYSAHRRYEYDAAKRTLTITYLPEAPKELRGSRSLLDLLLRQVEEARKQGLVVDIRKESQTEAGRAYTIYIVTIPEHGAEARIAVDNATQRIVRMRTATAEGPEAPGNYVLEVDYPERGPSDIYAIGVPRNARIVESLPSTDLLQLHEEVEEARSSFAPSYRAIIWRGHASRNGTSYELSQLVVVYKKNARYRLEWGREPVALALPGGRGLEEVLERLHADEGAALEKWVRQVRPRDVYFNENTIDSKGVRLSLSPEGELQRDTVHGLPGDNTVEDLTWSWAVNVRSGKTFAGKAGQSGPLLGTGYDVQGYVYNGEIAFPSRIRRFWNPARDYAREEFEQLQDANAPWQEDRDWMKGADPDLIKRRWLSDLDEMKNYRCTRTSRIVEYGRTPEGQWYAKRIVHESTSNLRASSPQMVVVHLDTDATISDELLDPDSVTPGMLAPQGVWQVAFDKAMAVIDARETWPATPRGVAEAYWKARNAKDWDEMAVLWPGSAAWQSILADEKPVEYVFGEAERDARSNQIVVPYAAKDYYEKHGTYNLKMRLTSDKSSKERYYVVSGN